jgi:signal transduction histidine kinase
VKVRSLRSRFLAASGALLVTQLATFGLALVIFAYALGSVSRQQALAETRVELAALGSAVREQYVHQAHTYIEGGAGHLHHGSLAADAVRERLDRLAQAEHGLVDAGSLELIRVNLEQLDAWFRERVEPLARAGTLDRARAADLHAATEKLTRDTTATIDALLEQLEAAQAREQARVARRATGAVLATLCLAALGLLASTFVARSLAHAVLAPVDAIRSAALAWRPGVRPEGADELGEVALAFDAIVRQLSEATEQRLESARLAALGEMSAAVAHELMNPLTVILGQLGEVEPGVAEPIRAEAEHARRIVQGLLGFARPMEQQPVSVRVDELAQAAVDRAIALADTRDIEVHLTHREPAVVTASVSAVRQILDNLLNNALEASAAGAVVEVEVRAHPVRVEVRDRGPGLPPRVRARLYEPFVTGRPTGTGLGLAVCQRIARSLGSTLSHTDRPGGGTVATWSFGP